MTARRQVQGVLAAGLALALLLTAAVNFAALVVPIYDMQLYDRVLQSRNMDTLGVLSVACAAGLVLFAVLDFLRTACLGAIGEAVGRLLDPLVLDEGVRRAASGDRAAGTELVRDLNEIQGFLTSGAVAVPLDALCAPIMLAVLFMLHPGYGFLGLAGVSALVLGGLLTEWRLRTALLDAKRRRTDAGQALAFALAEPEVPDALGLLPALGRRWAARHGIALAELHRVSIVALALAGVVRLARLSLQAGVMMVGALLVIAGATTPGSMMGANLLMGRLLGPFDQLVGTWRHWTLAFAAWRRIDALLRARTAVAAASPASADAPAGALLQGAAVRAADGRTLLHGIDLILRPGALVTVTGPNGAGKTTLLRLLAGLVPPSSGAVLLDGAPVAGGRHVGYLPQAVALLDGTVAENIARFRQDGLDDVIDAARRAGVHDAVGRLPRGYDTMLTGNGATLSGGMRQRIGLARALYGRPRLLILDEPDASLDAEGDAALLAALRACCAEGAVVVVTTHRPALRAAADQVVALRGGTLAPVAAPAAVPAVIPAAVPAVIPAAVPAVIPAAVPAVARVTLATA